MINRIKDIFTRELFTSELILESKDFETIVNGKHIQKGTSKIIKQINRADAGLDIKVPYTRETVYSEPTPVDSSDNEIQSSTMIEKSMDRGYLGFYAKSFGQKDIVECIGSGIDPIVAINTMLKRYWSKNIQSRIIDTVKGLAKFDIQYAPLSLKEHYRSIFNKDLKIGLTHYDIDQYSGYNYKLKVAKRFSYDLVLDAIHGYNEKFVTMICHSNIYKKMLKNNEIEFKKDSETGTVLKYYNGMQVIIDDRMIYEEEGTLYINDKSTVDLCSMFNTPYSDVFYQNPQAFADKIFENINIETLDFKYDGEISEYSDYFNIEGMPYPIVGNNIFDSVVIPCRLVPVGYEEYNEQNAKFEYRRKPLYLTAFLANNAFTISEDDYKIGTTLVHNELSGNGAGETELLSRKKILVHPNGYNYLRRSKDITIDLSNEVGNIIKNSFADSYLNDASDLIDCEKVIKEKKISPLNSELKKGLSFGNYQYNLSNSFNFDNYQEGELFVMDGGGFPNIETVLYNQYVTQGQTFFKEYKVTNSDEGCSFGIKDTLKIAPYRELKGTFDDFMNRYKNNEIEFQMNESLVDNEAKFCVFSTSAKAPGTNTREIGFKLGVGGEIPNNSVNSYVIYPTNTSSSVMSTYPKNVICNAANMQINSNYASFYRQCCLFKGYNIKGLNSDIQKYFAITDYNGEEVPAFSFNFTFPSITAQNTAFKSNINQINFSKNTQKFDVPATNEIHITETKMVNGASVISNKIIYKNNNATTTYNLIDYIDDFLEYVNTNTITENGYKIYYHQDFDLPADQKIEKKEHRSFIHLIANDNCMYMENGDVTNIWISTINVYSSGTTNNTSVKIDKTDSVIGTLTTAPAVIGGTMNNIVLPSEYSFVRSQSVSKEYGYYDLMKGNEKILRLRPLISAGSATQFVQKNKIPKYDNKYKIPFIRYSDYMRDYNGHVVNEGYYPSNFEKEIDKLLNQSRNLHQPNLGLYNKMYSKDNYYFVNKKKMLETQKEIEDKYIKPSKFAFLLSSD